MTNKGFDYETIIQKALLGAVRTILDQVSKEGLSGSHHFYLTFQSDRPDVVVPEFLRERHPQEITIVLQHQFWDLKVDGHNIEVTLSFNDSLERLVIPFGALTTFLDPSVKFALQFIPTAPLTSDKKDKSKLQQNQTQEKDKRTNIVSLETFRKK